MALFRRKTPQVVSRGSGRQAPPERTTKNVGGETVEIARFKAPPKEPTQPKKSQKQQPKPRQPKPQQRKPSDRNRNRNRNRSGNG